MLILYLIFKKLLPICWGELQLVANVKTNLGIEGGVGGGVKVGLKDKKLKILELESPPRPQLEFLHFLAFSTS